MCIRDRYNVVDSIFIGQYSQEGLNATSLAYPLQMLLIAVAVGTGAVSYTHLHSIQITT